MNPLTLEENVSMVARRRASRPNVPERRETHLSWSAPGRKLAMHAGTLLNRSAMKPLVFDGDLDPRPATVNVANIDAKLADTKSKDGHNPVQYARPRRRSRAHPRGRPTTLWSAIDHQDQELIEEECGRTEESSKEPITTLITHHLAISRTEESSEMPITTLTTHHLAISRTEKSSEAPT